MASFETPRRNMIEAHECRSVCRPTGHPILARCPDDGVKVGAAERAALLAREQERIVVGGRDPRPKRACERGGERDRADAVA
jgi:hypothetical protein